MVRSTVLTRLADGLPLAQSVDDDETERSLSEYKQQAKLIIRRLATPNAEPRCTIESGPFTLHYLIHPPAADPASVVYLTITDKSYPRKLAFSYLDELSKEFERSHGSQLAQRNLRPYAFVSFDTFMQRTKRLYADSRTAQTAAASNLDRLNDDLQDISRIMTKSMDDLLWRGETLDQMSTMSSSLRDESAKYRKAARHININALYRKWAPVGAVVLLFIFVVWVRFGLDRPVKRFSLTISERVIWADGNPVSSVLINGSLPGPEIRVNVGDRVLVNVTNALASQNTTLHIHGMSQRMTPMSDGTPLVSQWPIAPGNWFEYELVIQNSDQGSYYYHSHVELQAITAYGAFIVDAPIPRAYKSIKAERTLILGDWYWQKSDTITKGLLGNPFVWPGSSKAILVNGQALNACNETIAKTNAGLSCADTKAAGPHVVSVPFSKNIRLRLIGALTLSYTAFGILNHNTTAGGPFTIIGADGTYLNPVHHQTHVEVMPGQRYEVLFRSKSAQQAQLDGKAGCYWIRTESRWRTPAAGGWAILAYPSCTESAQSMMLESGPPLPPGTSSANATLLPPAEFGWIAKQFSPLLWSGAGLMASAPQDWEVKRRIVIQAQQIGVFGTVQNGTGTRWAENGHVYNEMMTRKTPYLIDIFNKAVEVPSYQRAMQGTPQGFDNVTDTYVARSGDVFDVVIINNASAKSHNVETHPWHGHSTKQWTMASGMGNFSEEALAAVRAEGFHHPIARDTHTVWGGPGASTTNQTLPTDSSGGWTMIRYRIAADGSDSGVFPLHCHILFHSAMGMFTNFVFDPQDVAAATQFYDDPSYLVFGHNVTSRYTRAHGKRPKSA
ncbi:hypothetical protein CF319_g3980 [Tilletia indica]|nr:hypothetical protein CF319_g3980 [Tilletia indica]